MNFNPSETPSSVGHHFLIGLQPTISLSDRDKLVLERLRPAGVVLFRENFQQNCPYEEWLRQYRSLIREIRSYIGREHFIVSIDHEGGLVTRPPFPITAYAHPRHWAEMAREVGVAMGTELSSLGINVSFSPVVDIDSNPKNPVIGLRAFGSTPEDVTRTASAYVEGIQSAGVIACLKHYPGHGDTNLDSHLELPRVDCDLEQLRRRELIPFRHIISQGAQLIMTAHILFPQIDPGMPATASRRLIHDTLRSDLGFHGVVVTDDLGMEAVSELARNPEFTMKVLSAGCDLLMICSAWTDTYRAFDMARNIYDGLRDRKLPKSDLNDSFERIETFIEGLPQGEIYMLPEAVFEEHRRIAPLYARPEIYSAGC